MENQLDGMIRSKSAEMSLENVFQCVAPISETQLETVKTTVKKYGFVMKELVLYDVVPDADVQKAMNDVIIEAYKIDIVNRAEGDKEKLKLKGEALALMREAIANGQEESINIITEKLGISAEDAMNYLSKIMQIDALKELSGPENTKIVFYPLNNKNMTDLMSREILKQE
eukprot:gene8387-212_t